MPSNNPILVMAPFNVTFNVTTAIFITILVVVSLWIKDKSDELKRNVITVACLLTFVGFFLYKYNLSLDSEYNEIMAFNGGFNWWAELPLHFCNINMLLIPLSLKLNYRPLMSFCFFAAPLAAFMAVAIPAVVFEGYSLLIPRIMGFYLTHFMIVIAGLSIAAFGLYKPKFSDLPRTVLILICISAVIFGFNMILRFTGIYPKANYFFTVSPEKNALLEIFYSWIPCPYFYLIPSIGILGVYMTIVTTGFYIFGKVKRKEQA